MFFLSQDQDYHDPVSYRRPSALSQPRLKVYSSLSFQSVPPSRTFIITLDPFSLILILIFIIGIFNFDICKYNYCTASTSLTQPWSEDSRGNLVVLITPTALSSTSTRLDWWNEKRYLYIHGQTSATSAASD